MDFDAENEQRLEKAQLGLMWIEFKRLERECDALEASAQPLRSGRSPPPSLPPSKSPMREIVRPNGLPLKAGATEQETSNAPRLRDLQQPDGDTPHSYFFNKTEARAAIAEARLRKETLLLDLESRKRSPYLPWVGWLALMLIVTLTSGLIGWELATQEIIATEHTISVGSTHDVGLDNPETNDVAADDASTASDHEGSEPWVNLLITFAPILFVPAFFLVRRFFLNFYKKTGGAEAATIGILGIVALATGGLEDINAFNHQITALLGENYLGLCFILPAASLFFVRPTNLTSATIQIILFSAIGAVTVYLWHSLEAQSFEAALRTLRFAVISAGLSYWAGILTAAAVIGLIGFSSQSLLAQFTRTGSAA